MFSLFISSTKLVITDIKLFHIFSIYYTHVLNFHDRFKARDVTAFIPIPDYIYIYSYIVNNYFNVPEMRINPSPVGPYNPTFILLMKFCDYLIHDLNDIETHHPSLLSNVPLAMQAIVNFNQFFEPSFSCSPKA